MSYFAQVPSKFFQGQFANQLQVVVDLQRLLDLKVAFSQEQLPEEGHLCDGLVNSEIVVYYFPHRGAAALIN
jgi:hypothetical protein